ncbi:uncharacterized protein [Amphiura filiformis]|uniref:uncharacterized protein isoform X1 n=1 Tax=Amphiura filiformis TaxID=82378 RepID=UPI003B21D246
MSNEDPLYKACVQGSLEKVKELSEDGFTQTDIDARYEDSRSTLLHVAASGRHSELIAFLLEHGFKSIINESDRSEYTALHVAAIKGDKKVCEILFDAGADVSIVNQQGNTAFHEACKQRSSEVCNLLLEACKESLDLPNKIGDTPLLIAARHDSLEVFRLLLEEDVDRYVKDGTGESVLHVASQRSCPELCQTLIAKDHGKDLLSQPDIKDGNTPLHKATERNHPEICALLLDNDCEVDVKNKHGNTALHLAAITIDGENPDNGPEIFKKLLDKNADWKLTNSNLDTSLHIAARRVNVKICDMLLEKGANSLVLQENNAMHCPWDLVPTARQYKLNELKAETDRARFNKLEKESGTTPIKHVKLFLCGDQAVGKTTLKRSLVKGRIASWLPRRRIARHIPTPGVNVTPKHIRDVGDFVIWDMAGQIEYHVTHAMLLGSSCGVFVVVFNMKWNMETKRKKLMYWLSFIKAGHKVKEDRLKPPIVVVGTHADQLEDRKEEHDKAQDLLGEIIELFAEFLNIHPDIMMINGRAPRSASIRSLKGVIKQLAKPLRDKTTPNICSEVSKKMVRWAKKKSKLPIMNFDEFLAKVNQDVEPLADESLVRLVLGYLNETGELHQAKVRQAGENAHNDLIILNPNWLTTTIFGPIFAKPKFYKHYCGMQEKQVYTLDDLKANFRKIENPRILVELLEYFELAFKRDDGKDDTSFILPVKLPPDVKEIDWTGHDQYSNIYGIRIECKDETDMFTSDTFPCLQVRAMNQYKHSNVEPKLSHRGLKVCKDVEGMIQLTEDKRAIHIAVRMTEEEKSLGRLQLDDMTEMAYYECNERSIGTQTTLLYLSPNDLRKGKDLDDDVHYYSEKDLNECIQNNGDLVHPGKMKKESVASVTGLQQKDIFDTVEPLSPSKFSTDDKSDYKLLVDDKSLRDLAEQISDSDREALGHYLGIKNSIIFGFKSDYVNVKEQMYQMLIHWRQTQGRDVNTDELKDALVRIKRRDLAYGVSASAATLTDDRLEYIVQILDKRQWQYLAIKLKCPPEEVYEKEQTAEVFIKWRKLQPRDVDVIKYMAAGLKSIGRKNVADLVEKFSPVATSTDNEATPHHPSTSYQPHAGLHDEEQ